MGPRHELAVRIEPGRQAVVVGGAVHIVLDVFLATPNNLHRPIHLFRDLDGEDVAVDIKPPAETAADQMVRTLPLP